MEATTSGRTAATVTINEDGSARLTVGDRVETLVEASVDAARESALSIIAAHATLLGHPIQVTCTDPDGVAKLVVSRDGSVRESTRATAGSIVITAPVTGGAPEVARITRADGTAVAAAPATDGPALTAPAPAAASASASAPTAAPAPASPAPSVEPVAESPRAESPRAESPRAETRAMRVAEQVAPPAPTPTPTPAPATGGSSAARRSFIAEEKKAPRAEQGFRGALAKMGLPVGPSAAEAAERADIASVSRHWPGPRTIAIVNGKGGASKTPTTAMLSAVFARHGGSGVLAWDNNETRGTLGWRTEQGQHEATVQALLPNAEQLMSAGAQASDLASYLHHQVADKYDVLRSNPNILAEDQRLTMGEFDAIHAVAAKYFRLIFIDSGNDESADRWRRMIDRADQIVIATTARGEHAEAGALLLEALRERGEHSAALAKNAIVVVSQADHKGGIRQAEHVAEGFRQMARGATVIPFDPAMRAGKLTFDSLKPETQRAWLASASAVAQGL